MKRPRLLRRARQSRILRRLAVTAFAASVLALAAALTLAGWLLHDVLEDDAQVSSIQVDRPVLVVEDDVVGSETLPNVLALPEAIARQALLDSGIDLASVTSGEVPYVGDPGLVVEQFPLGGAARSDRVVLKISRPATMAQLRGKGVDEARAELSSVGAVAVVTQRYDPAATPGSVLETAPSAGEQITDRVTLVVAEPPSSVFLAQLSAEDSSCGTDTVNVGGRERTDALVCSPGEGSPSAVDYLLNRRITTLEAVLGVSDRGATDVPVTFLILVDGQLVRSQRIEFGSPRAVEIPVLGAVRLTIRATAGSSGPSGEQVEAVIADARLLGGRSAVDALAAESQP